jgi:hypothetical protein
VNSFETIEKTLHTRLMLLQLLMDLGVEGAVMPRQKAWSLYMDFLAVSYLQGEGM